MGCGAGMTSSLGAFLLATRLLESISCYDRSPGKSPSKSTTIFMSLTSTSTLPLCYTFSSSELLPISSFSALFLPELSLDLAGDYSLVEAKSSSSSSLGTFYSLYASSNCM